jgi:HD-GYP domain-containing protein (c-di-GMP phosphodiesterase class II)
MRHITMEKLQPGHFLGRNVLNANGTILLKEGVQLTPAMISTLKNIGVTALYIKDSNFEDVKPEQVLSDETKHLVIGKLNELYKAIKSGKDINSREISVGVEAIMKDVMKNKTVLIELNEIRTKDLEQYLHAMNVCVMSTMVGNSMGLNQLQLKELSVGALLHDVGKIVPECNDKSVDPKMHHTWKGFEIIKKRQEFNLLIAHTAFQHHETMDGKGFPRGIGGDQIHQYARIVAVANLYENLLFDTDTSKRMLPHDACEHLMSLAYNKIDREVLLHFLKCVSVYPTGVSVQLSNGDIGIVVGQHRGLPGRPIVRIIISDEQPYTLEVKQVDLAEAANATVFITKVL